MPNFSFKNVKYFQKIAFYSKIKLVFQLNYSFIYKFYKTHLVHPLSALNIWEEHLQINGIHQLNFKSRNVNLLN
jgi:hypothetical protein